MRPMTKLLPLAALLLPLRLGAQQTIDDFWAEVVRTVQQGDFQGLADTYHEAAVLVSGANGTAVPIAEAMAGWKPDIDATRDGELTVSLDFRFSQRIHGEAAAHDTGIFRYSSRRGNAEPTTYFVHLQGLLVREDDGWKLVMEYQVAPATEEEWNALGG